jgi:hypothetical protein
MHLSASTTDAFFFSQLQGPDDDFSDHISIRAVDASRRGRPLRRLQRRVPGDARLVPAAELGGASSCATPASPRRT